MGICYLYKRGSGSGGSGGSIVEIIKTASGSIITLSDSAQKALRGLKVFGKTLQNGTPTPDAPVSLESVGDGGSVGVTVAGKNLLDASIPAKQMVDIGNGYYAQIFKIGRGNTVTVSLDKRYATGLTGSYIKIMAGDKTSELTEIAWLYHATVPDMCSQKSTITLEYNILAVCFTTSSYAWAKDVMQVELGSVATAYEPYKETNTITIQKPTDVPVFLPGIPVSSGGNYTDATGKQWICDEVDFARGKYVQRVNKVVFDGSDDEAWSYGNSYINYPNDKTLYTRIYTKVSTLGMKGNSFMLCDKLSNHGYGADFIPKHGAELWNNSTYLHILPGKAYPNSENNLSTMRVWLSENPVTVLYELAEPIEHDLSADELDQYAALHTNYPNTTILNDGGAGMEVKYVTIGG